MSMDMQAQTQAEINQSMPYKLPPETSVQLVPATPEEQERSSSPPLPMTASSSSFKRERQKEQKQSNTTTTTTMPAKRQRRTAAQKARDSIVISDEEDEDNQPLKKPAKQRTPKNTSQVQLPLSANIISQLGMLSGGSGGDEANEASNGVINLCRQRQCTTNHSGMDT